MAKTPLNKASVELLYNSTSDLALHIANIRHLMKEVPELDYGEFVGTHQWNVDNIKDWAEAVHSKVETTVKQYKRKMAIADAHKEVISGKKSRKKDSDI